MKANLFINYYVDSSKERQEELDVCVIANIENPQIDTLTILLSDKDLISLNDLTKDLDVENQLKIDTIVFEGRPTYNDYFKLTEAYPKDINIIANTDMIMDSLSIKRLKGWEWGNNCLALSRWDFINNTCRYADATLFNRPDSQDVWMKKGAFRQINEVYFGLGVAGCDNSIAHHLSKYYNVINPSLDIKTYHYHLSQVRNYTNVNGIAITRIEPPYQLVTPTLLT
jgi:hypothetical protein